MSDDNPTSARREWIVAGRVQRVAFRAATRHKALELGLRGTAENLDNGCVHVVAMGDAASLDKLDTWLQNGPPQARVTQLRRVAELDWSSYPSMDHKGFDTR